MGVSPSKPKSKQKGKPMTPSRVESARESPKWLEAPAHGDVFALTAPPVGSRVDDGSAYDTEYARDKRDSRNSQLDPVGILTSVRDGSANGNTKVEYTYTWPEPTTGPLLALAGIWHCTQFTATVDYRDKDARNRVSTAVMHSSSKSRAFRLTHALQKGGEISWSKLEARIKEALGRNLRSDGYKEGKSVWKKWWEKLPKEERGRFQTAEKTLDLMVRHIREYVDRHAVQTASIASVLAASKRAVRAESGRLATALEDAAREARKLREGTGYTKPSPLKALVDKFPDHTVNALEGLSRMARESPVEVQEFLLCFLDTSFKSVRRYEVPKPSKKCEPDWHTMNRLFPDAFHGTLSALFALTGGMQTETWTYFASFFSTDVAPYAEEKRKETAAPTV